MLILSHWGSTTRTTAWFLFSFLFQQHTASAWDGRIRGLWRYSGDHAKVNGWYCPKLPPVPADQHYKTLESHVTRVRERAACRSISTFISFPFRTWWLFASWCTQYAVCMYSSLNMRKCPSKYKVQDTKDINPLLEAILAGNRPSVPLDHPDDIKTKPLLSSMNWSLGGTSICLDLLCG